MSYSAEAAAAAHSSTHPMVAVAQWIGYSGSDGSAAGLGLGLCIFAVGAVAGIAVWLAERGRSQPKD